MTNCSWLPPSILCTEPKTSPRDHLERSPREAIPRVHWKMHRAAYIDTLCVLCIGVMFCRPLVHWPVLVGTYRLALHDEQLTEGSIENCLKDKSTVRESRRPGVSPPPPPRCTKVSSESISTDLCWRTKLNFSNIGTHCLISQEVGAGSSGLSAENSVLAFWYDGRSYDTLRKKAAGCGNWLDQCSEFNKHWIEEIKNIALIELTSALVEYLYTNKLQQMTEPVEPFCDNQFNRHKIT